MGLCFSSAPSRNSVYPSLPHPPPPHGSPLTASPLLPIDLSHRSPPLPALLGPSAWGGRPSEFPLDLKWADKRSRGGKSKGNRRKPPPTEKSAMLMDFTPKFHLPFPTQQRAVESAQTELFEGLKGFPPGRLFFVPHEENENPLDNLNSQKSQQSRHSQSQVIQQPIQKEGEGEIEGEVIEGKVTEGIPSVWSDDPLNSIGKGEIPGVSSATSSMRGNPQERKLSVVTANCPPSVTQNSESHQFTFRSK